MLQTLILRMKSLNKIRIRVSNFWNFCKLIMESKMRPNKIIGRYWLVCKSNMLTAKQLHILILTLIYFFICQQIRSISKTHCFVGH